MTVLTAKNMLLESTIGMRELPYWSDVADDPGYRGMISAADITRIISSDTYWFLKNQLVFTLEATPEEVRTNSFKISIGASPSSFKTFWRNRTPGGSPPYPEWDFWNMIQDGGSVERVRYVSVSRNRLTIEVSNQTIMGIKSRILSSGLEFGILILPIKFIDPDGVEFQLTYGIKVTTNELYTTAPAIAAGVRTELSPPVTEPEYTSPVYSFESMHVPQLSCKFIYNFYEINEGNFDTINSRRYEGLKISEIPKYMELSWDASPKVSPIVVEVSAGGDVEVRPHVDPPPTVVTPAGGGEVIVRAHEEGTAAGSGGTTETRAERQARRAALLAARAAAEADVGSGTAMVGGYAYDLGDAGTSRLIGSGLGGLGGPGAPSGTGVEDLREEAASRVAGVLGASLRSPGGLIPSGLGTDSTIEGGITGFPSPEMGLPFINSGYVGYTVQKERYDEIEETYVPIDVFLINKRETTKFIDWKIAYGEVYRYRIRSVFRFVNKHRLSMYRDSDELIDNSLEFSKFETGIAAGGVEIYYYDGKSSLDYEIDALESVRPDPPYNVKIFPCSKKREIFITWNQKNQNKDVLG